jgi:signal transduction histidine kinase/DNA-binding response OmpR family regulator
VINNKKEASTIIGETRTNSQAIIRQIMTEFSDLSSREAILDFVDFSKIDERLRNRNTITLEWLNADGEWRRSRYIVSERTPAGYVARALYLIEDIDSEKNERDTALETIDKMNEQISSVASIYFRMADLNFENDTVQMIRTQMQEGQGTFIDGIIDGAYAYIKNVMENFVEDSSRQTMLDFIDYNTLNDRLKNTNTITEEFISKKIGWCRARYIVSKRKEDGTVAHALWLVEIIDEEKRRRDMLTRAAETLNDRASSIANIYMTVHEVDLITDTFTEIRSELDYVNDVIGESKSNAQVTLNRVMDNVVHESCIEDIIKFVNFRTLEKRLRKTDTITMEYMNKEKLWRRGRFIVSKRDENGKLTRVIWLTEDIHDEKIERDKLIDMSQRALAASEAKSAFLSNMSHEIRTPINAVLGMNEMILRECEDENIVSYSNTIRTAGATLLGLVNDILDFSKIEAGKLEIIPVDYDLSSVISDLVNMIQQKADDKGLRLILEINKDVPKQLHGDEVRIKQVITNILTNAVKYTEKGSVTFSIDYETIPDEPDMVSLNIAVKDTGIGIKKKDMYRLFSEFDRIDEERNRKVEGTGLGMSITKRLLEMMGSILEVESIYKLGSKFSFKLKQQVVKWDKLGNYEAAYKAALGNREKYHEKFRAPDAEILIIDDTPENIMVFESLLKQTCVQIETAESGDEGIALSYNKKFDIIFIDHMMPNKDGIETLYEMREDENNPNIDTPMVCLTANAISGARERYISEGFDDYLTKPIEPERLEQMLLEYLSKDKILSVDDETDVKAESGNLSDTTGSKWYDNLHEIDVDAALKNSGSEDMFYMVLQLYNEAFEERYEELNRLFETKDLEEYTIKVHALKSSSRLVGALELGDKAEALEHAGNDNDIEYITNNHEDMMESYRLLINEISPLFPEE